MPKRLWPLIFTLFLAACGGAVAEQPAIESAAPAEIIANLPADFLISAYQGETDLGGSEVHLSEVLAQGKPVVLNFWAGLCPPCRLEMPDLDAAHKKHGDDITLVGVDIGPQVNLGTNEQGRALVQELGVSYPVGSTAERGVKPLYRVIGMPTTLFITPDGEIIRTWTGLLTVDKLDELIGELLAASAA